MAIALNNRAGHMNVGHAFITYFDGHDVLSGMLMLETPLSYAIPDTPDPGYAAHPGVGKLTAVLKS